ncbi:hypothetical protein Trydic_g10307 [Trypoxylus dichotomus]
MLNDLLLARWWRTRLMLSPPLQPFILLLRTVSRTGGKGVLILGRCRPPAFSGEHISALHRTHRTMRNVFKACVSILKTFFAGKEPWFGTACAECTVCNTMLKPVVVSNMVYAPVNYCRTNLEDAITYFLEDL